MYVCFIFERSVIFSSENALGSCIITKHASTVGVYITENQYCWFMLAISIYLKLTTIDPNFLLKTHIRSNILYYFVQNVACNQTLRVR